MSKESTRADRLLVTLGKFESRSAAQAAIAAGGVFCDGVRVRKPSQMLPLNGVIIAQAAHPYVSRGGLKLARALEVFGLDVTGRACLDLGASTGGFTDCLLRHDAASVVAVDVGRDQLHARLRSDKRVTVFESLDARDLTRTHMPAETSLIVTDLSFIGLEKALGAALGLVRGGGALVALFKPQFQVGRANIGRGGIVTDIAQSQRAEAEFGDWLSSVGWRVRDACDSPIRGGDGNAERLVWAVKNER